MENRRIPKVRFPEYTGDWRQEKLGDIVEFYSGLTYSPDNVQENGTLVLRSSNVKNDAIVSADDVFVDSKIAKSEQVKIGDVIIVVRNGSRSLIGKHAMIKRDMPNTVIGAFMTGLRSDEPDFANALLGTVQFAKEIQKNLGATINQITTGEFKKMTFKVPTNKDEQRKIGTFISSFDNFITLQQQEHDMLKQTKQGFLQKMFPKDGESIPEVRFPGFTDDWEECKLGELADVTKLAGFEFTKYVIYSDTGEIIALRGLNVKQGDLILDEVKYIDKSDFSKLNRSKLFKNDILFTYVGTVGELAVVPVDDKYYLAPNVARIRVDKNTNPIFISQMMRDKDFYNRVISPLIATSSQPALSMENVRKFNFHIPSLKEQELIGDFFKQLDDIIALHQRELNVLKETKKAFLQKMFI